MSVFSRFASLVLVWCLLTWPVLADEVTNWNANAGKAAVAACISPFDDPLHESRLYAMMHLAIHDALNAIDRRSEPYIFRDRPVASASFNAAIAAAARDTLVSGINELPSFLPSHCRPAGIASVEADYIAALSSIPDDEAKVKGIEIGRAAAAGIIALRAGDGSSAPMIDPAYVQGSEPGEYRFTPGFDFVFGTEWGKVKPFVLNHGSQFNPPPPYKLNTKKYLEDYLEVKNYGGNGVDTPSARTADETELALFWVESSPLAWNRLARNISASRQLDAWENARLFGLLNMAMADGYIGSWDAKFDYNFWRPVTAIRIADTDGNPDTIANPTWTPLVPTPPIPDHDSGHSVQGGAAAEVLRRFFGTDHISFSACSVSLPAGSRCNDAVAVLRSFASFSHAEAENGLSRIMVGFHFRKAVEDGIKHGRSIADRAVNLFLRQLHR
jgi:hypothetical protein